MTHEDIKQFEDTRAIFWRLKGETLEAIEQLECATMDEFINHPLWDGLEDLGHAELHYRESYFAAHNLSRHLPIEQHHADFRWNEAHPNI